MRSGFIVSGLLCSLQNPSPAATTTRQGFWLSLGLLQTAGTIMQEAVLLHQGNQIPHPPPREQGSKREWRVRQSWVGTLPASPFSSPASPHSTRIAGACGCWETLSVNPGILGTQVRNPQSWSWELRTQSKPFTWRCLSFPNTYL